MLYARFRRCLYLILIGFWQGEIAVDFRDDEGRTKVIGSGIERAPGVYKPFHIWWQRAPRQNISAAREPGHQSR